MDKEYKEEDDLGIQIKNLEFLNRLVEFSCYLDFHYTFDLNKETNNLSDLSSICNILNIDCDFDLIIEKRCDEKFRDVLVFHSNTEEYSFLYFDLEKEMTDQSDLFLIGICCNVEKESEINDVLSKISKNQGTVIRDFDKKRLFHEVYFSFEYFYDKRYNKYKKQMEHYGK